MSGEYPIVDGDQLKDLPDRTRVQMQDGDVWVMDREHEFSLDFSPAWFDPGNPERWFYSDDVIAWCGPGRVQP